MPVLTGKDWWLPPRLWKGNEDLLLDDENLNPGHRNKCSRFRFFYFFGEALVRMVPADKKS